MTNINTVIETWQTFQQQIKAPQTEANYLELLEFITNLIEKYDTNTEPYRSLWRCTGELCPRVGKAQPPQTARV